MRRPTFPPQSPPCDGHSEREMSGPTPFQVRWSEAEIEAILAQVRNYTWPPDCTGG